MNTMKEDLKFSMKKTKNFHKKFPHLSRDLDILSFENFPEKLELNQPLMHKIT